MRGGGSALLLAGCLLAAAGCRPPAPATDGTVDVGGRVEGADGKPLTGVLLRFRPEGGADKLQSLLCPVREGGKFVGRCRPGRYKVTLVGSAAAAPADEGAKKGPPRPPPLPEGVPAAYGKVDTTPWEVRVPVGGKTDMVFKVRGE